jgi:hypothetical protein
MGAFDHGLSYREDSVSDRVMNNDMAEKNPAITQ